MFCTQCGNGLNEDQKFCDGCGMATVAGKTGIQVSGVNKHDESLSEKDSSGLSELSSSLSKLKIQVASIESQVKAVSARLTTVEKVPVSSSIPIQSQEEVVITDGKEGNIIDETPVKKKKRWLRVLLTILIITIVMLVLVVLAYVFRAELLNVLEEWGLRTDWLRRELNIY